MQPNGTQQNQGITPISDHNRQRPQHPNTNQLIPQMQVQHAAAPPVQYQNNSYLPGQINNLQQASNAPPSHQMTQHQPGPHHSQTHGPSFNPPIVRPVNFSSQPARNNETHNIQTSHVPHLQPNPRIGGSAYENMTSSQIARPQINLGNRHPTTQPPSNSQFSQIQKPSLMMQSSSSQNGMSNFSQPPVPIRPPFDSQVTPLIQGDSNTNVHMNSSNHLNDYKIQNMVNSNPNIPSYQQLGQKSIQYNQQPVALEQKKIPNLPNVNQYSQAQQTLRNPGQQTISHPNPPNYGHQILNQQMQPPHLQHNMGYTQSARPTIQIPQMQPAKSTPPLHPQPSVSQIPPITNPAMIQQHPSQNKPQPPKISASQMPNVVDVIEQDANRWPSSDSYYQTTSAITHGNTTDQHSVMPPLPILIPSIPIVDEGNCSPRFMRSTMYQLPTTEDLCHSSKIPLGMIIQPFARQHPREPPIPLIDSSSIIRCTRCRSFLNPYCRFTRGGRNFECSICGVSNEVNEAYFCPLDASGRRSDLEHRPELRLGTVEYLAPVEYHSSAKSPPTLPNLLFLIDASRSAVQNGGIIAAARAIRAFVFDFSNLAPENRPYGGIAISVFDRNVSVFDFRAVSDGSSSEPGIIVMSDIQEPFVPVAPTTLFFDPTNSHAAEKLETLLTRLPSMFSGLVGAESCLGTAVSFAVQALESSGGRAAVFLSSNPTVGPGQLKPRELQPASAKSNTDKPDPTLAPQNDWYTRLAKDAASKAVSFVLIVTGGNSPPDIATIGQLNLLTSGNILHYPRFSLDSSSSLGSLVGELAYTLLKPFIVDCVLRVRVGSGLQIGEYFGAFTSLNQTDYLFASLDCDQSFACSFLYDAKLVEGEHVVFQCAALHTNTRGQRVIRVSNLAIPTTSGIANVFRMADVDTFVHLSVKRAIVSLKSNHPSNLLNTIHIRSAQLLAAYRKNCASNMPSGQLVLPESFKLLPLFCLSLAKNTAFCPTIIPADLRFVALIKMLQTSLSDMPLLLYPRLYQISFPLSDGTVSTKQLRLSREHISPTGIYISENGARVMIWIGSQADSNLLTAIFGVPNLDSLNPAAFSSTAALNIENQKNSVQTNISKIINELILPRHQRQYLPLLVIRSGIDHSEIDWANSLIEDGQAALGPSYVDFLCRLHNQINVEMNSSSLAERAALLSFLQ